MATASTPTSPTSSPFTSTSTTSSDEEGGAATLRLCEDNEVGEIWVSSPLVAQGYWQEPEKTAATFHNQLPPSAPAHLCTTPDGGVRLWLATGDLGCLEAGNLYITGRKKELIIIRGRNIYPVDLEHSLLAFPALRRGCCVALGLTAEEAVEARANRFLKSKKRKGAQSLALPSPALATEQIVVVAEMKEDGAMRKELEKLARDICAIIAAEHSQQVAVCYLMPPHTLAKTTSGKLKRVFLRQQLLQYELTKAPLHVLDNDEVVEKENSSNSSDGSVDGGGVVTPASELSLPEWNWKLPVEQREAFIVESILLLVAHDTGSAPITLASDADLQLGELGIDSLQSITLLQALRTQMEAALAALKPRKPPTSAEAQAAALNDLFSPTLLYEFQSLRSLAIHLAEFHSGEGCDNESQWHSVDADKLVRQWSHRIDINKDEGETASPLSAPSSSSPASTTSPLPEGAVSTPAYLLCVVAQFLTLATFWGWLLLAASYAFHVLALIASHVSLLATLALVPLVYLALGLSLSLSVVLLKWLLLGRVQPGRHSVWGFFYLRWWVVDRLAHWTHLLALNHLQGTALYRAFLAAMGCPSALRADVVATTGISDWDLVTLGEGCVVDSDALIQGHSLQGQWLTLAPVEVGTGVYVQHRATVVPTPTGRVADTWDGPRPVIPGPTVLPAKAKVAAGDYSSPPALFKRLEASIEPPTAQSSPRSRPQWAPVVVAQKDSRTSHSYASTALRIVRGLLCDAFRLYAEGVVTVLAVIVAYEVLVRLSDAMGLIPSALASDALSWPGASSTSASLALPYTALVFLVGPQWLAPFVFWLARPQLSSAAVQAVFGAPTLFEWYQSTLLRSHYVIQLVFVCALAYLAYVWALAAALALWRLAVRALKWALAGRGRQGFSSYPLHGLVDAIQGAWAGTARRWAFSLSFVYSATSFQVWALRLMGARIGRSVVLADTRQWEAPEEVEVGARSFIGDLSSIQTDAYQCDPTGAHPPRITQGGVQLGPDCLLGMLGSIVADPSTTAHSIAVLPGGGLVGAGSHFDADAQQRLRAKATTTSSSTSTPGSSAVVLFGRHLSWKTGDTECPPWPLWFVVVWELLWPVLVSIAEMCVFVLALLPTATASLYLLTYHGFWLSALANCALGWLYWTSLVALLVLTKWALIGRFQPAQHALASGFFLRRLVFNHQLAFLRATGLEMWQGTQLLIGLYRLLGARMGARVALNSMLVTEPDLLEVGDYASVDARAVLFSHVVERGQMTLERVKVGRGCQVGQSCVLLCGSQMEDGVALTAASVAMKGQSLTRVQLAGGNSAASVNMYQGVPAVRRRQMQ